jgi:transcriptional accessory protein Tex/SPT6
LQYQVLAINRGEKKKELSVRIVLPEYFSSKFEQFFARLYNLNRSDQERETLIRRAIQDGFKRLGK